MAALLFKTLYCTHDGCLGSAVYCEAVEYSVSFFFSVDSVYAFDGEILIGSCVEE